MGEEVGGECLKGGGVVVGLGEGDGHCRRRIGGLIVSLKDGSELFCRRDSMDSSTTR